MLVFSRSLGAGSRHDRRALIPPLVHELADPARRVAPGGLPGPAQFAEGHAERRRRTNDARPQRGGQPGLPQARARDDGPGRRSVITHCWRERLEAQELVAIDHMLALAADFDEEAGFSPATPDVPGHGGELNHLLVRMPPKGERESPDLDALPDAEVVGYLQIGRAHV